MDNLAARKADVEELEAELGEKATVRLAEEEVPLEQRRMEAKIM
jgi:hypothetical protein